MAYIRTLGRGEKVPEGEPKRYADRDGYIRLRWTIAPGMLVEAREHRVFNGMVTGADHVHHRNGAKGDNRAENLSPLSTSEHTHIHSTLRHRFDREEAARLYEGGETTLTLAERYGVNPGNISRGLRIAGVKMRPPSARTADGKARLAAAQSRRWAKPGAKSQQAAASARWWASLTDEQRAEVGRSISRAKTRKP